MKLITDILIVGTGVSGLIAAINLCESKKVTLVTKAKLKESDSFLAQGGICVLQDKSDYDDYYEDDYYGNPSEDEPTFL